MTASDSNEKVIEHSALFNALWALYALLHIYKLTPWTSAVTPTHQIVNWLLISAALFVIFRPRNVWLFLVLNLLQVVSAMVQLPAMSNCWLLSGIISTGIVGVHISLMISKGIGNFTVVDVFASISPALRISLIALYGFVVIAKCNSAFFDVNSSCAYYFCELICQSYGIESPPSLLLWSSIPGTIIVELAIPILLIAQRTRVYGVLLGLVFHTVIAHSYKIVVFDFSALMLVLYYSFTNARLVTVLQESRIATPARWIARHRRVIFTSLTILILGLMLALSHKPTFIFIVIYKFRGIAWTIIGCSTAIFVLAELTIRRNEVFDIGHAFRFNSLITLGVVSVVALNGLSPYIGLKTGVSFTMFSNLRTERGFENHLFMPSALKIFSYQDQWVLPLESSEPELQKLADAKERLLVQDLRSRASRFPKADLRYRFHGEDRFCKSIKSDPLIGQPPSFIERKLLFFRSIPTYNHRHQW